MHVRSRRGSPTSARTQCYLAFDERMALHRPPPGSPHYPREETDQGPAENSSRIVIIHQRLLQLEQRLMVGTSRPRLVSLNPKFASRDTILLAHSVEHYEKMLRTATMSDEELLHLCKLDSDLYFCRDTFMAASLAVGGVVTCVNAVLSAAETGVGPTRAVALVRPPGHHASQNQAMGFCYFNNVFVAARHAIQTGSADRVFILDWDIHHGNGIQDLAYNDPNIFYLSLHRGNFGSSKHSLQNYFYPYTGRPEQTGHGSANGTNLNIAFPIRGMRDTEYAAAFSELVLPVMRSFHPDLIIVANGMDAAEGDILGDCALSPAMFYAMTKAVLNEAGSTIPIVVALEGGYHLETIAQCMEAVTLALLDEPYAVPTDVVDATKHCPKSSICQIWNHIDLLNKEHFRFAPTGNIVTDKALKAIRTSARHLAKTRRFPWSENYARPLQQPLRSDSHYLQTIPRVVVPLCNRPVQGKYLAPPSTIEYNFSLSGPGIWKSTSTSEDEDMKEGDGNHKRPEAQEWLLPLKKRRFVDSS